MIASASRTNASPLLAALQASFLSILPQIKTAGHVYFRHLRCADKKQDAMNEMIALTWKWFMRLSQRGKDPTEFPTILGAFAARAVNSGRRLCGQEKPKDVLSRVAQQRHGFTVDNFPQRSSTISTPVEEALQDNTQTPIPDQVSFRCDFPAWMTTRTYRDRRMIEDLMIGERTLDVSNKFGLSPARISQLRRDFHDDWQRFCAVREDDEQPVATESC